MTVGRDVDGVRRGLLRDARGQRLQAGTEGRLWAHDGPSERGAIALLHGFTAGTWQMVPLAERLFGLGFDVLVPRLPGHGGLDAEGRPDARALPRAARVDRYDVFADGVAADLARLGGPWSVLGLSGGGAVACRIAARHPGLQRLVLVSPFFAPRAAGVRRVLGLSERLDAATGGVSTSLLHALPYRFDAVDYPRPGHQAVALGHVHGLCRLGARAEAGLDGVRAPVQLVTTEADWAIDLDAVGRARDRLRGPVRWYHFPADERVPHALLHPLENKEEASRIRALEVIERFLTTGEGTDRPPARRA